MSLMQVYLFFLTFGTHIRLTCEILHIRNTDARTRDIRPKVDRQPIGNYGKDI